MPSWDAAREPDQRPDFGGGLSSALPFGVALDDVANGCALRSPLGCAHLDLGGRGVGQCRYDGVFLGYWQQRRIVTVERLNYMNQYGASLAWAAFDLQSRLHNILYGRYSALFLTQGTKEDAELARRSTVFVIAEYLGRVESSGATCSFSISAAAAPTAGA
ncbi:hypothetical protein ABZ153_40425 [Streptomyces sp. NPDC006290]|uniref:hypothetical protein n=1 Tax=Streptomyces sp. NPDC006290 TaxID=3156745 RepID=UPI0033BC6536